MKSKQHKALRQDPQYRQQIEGSVKHKKHVQQVYDAKKEIKEWL